MSLIDELSTSVGDRTQAANLAVLAKVQADPALLADLVPGLEQSNLKLTGDAVEVFTKIAETDPQAVVSYIPHILPLIKSKNTRVRWEAVHTVALTAELIPDSMAQILGDLAKIIADDESVIVRNYAVEALGTYAGTSPLAAQAVVPYLTSALNIWDERHLFLALEGFLNAAKADPSLSSTVQELAHKYADHKKAKVRKLVKKILAG